MESNTFRKGIKKIYGLFKHVKLAIDINKNIFMTFTFNKENALFDQVYEHICNASRIKECNNNKNCKSIF